MSETLKNLREGAKKTCTEAAQVLGVTVQAIRNYEYGIRRISLEHILLLAELYGVTEKEVIYAQLNSEMEGESG